MSAALTLNYRQPLMTVGCVRSLLADGWGPILVWDNSGDGGRSAAQIRAAFADESRVRVVESPVNLGFAAGVNRALQWLEEHGIQGPILIINNDAVVMPGAREAMLSAIEDDPGLALVAPLVEQDGTIQGWMYYQRWFGLVLRRKVPGAFAYLSGCCLLVNEGVPRKPLFDEDFFMYGEDAELSFRFAAAGLRSRLLPRVLVHHMGAAGSGVGSEFYERHLVRAHWLLAAKLAANAWQAFLLRCLRGVVLPARACVRCLRFRRLRPLGALAAAVFRSETGRHHP